MNGAGNGQPTLGINGLGRIGKLSLWYHLDRDNFDRFVVNLGRPVGRSLGDVAQYLEKDSTYGSLCRYLYGHRAKPEIRVVDEERGLLDVYGKEVLVLREERDPARLPWREHGVRVVVDATGRFVDPGAESDGAPALRGHIDAGAKVVVQSSPFKAARKEAPLPDDAIMLINGINQQEYDPDRHRLVSAASCTTTALAHMLRPLLDRKLTANMITAGMSTIHAVTNSQPVLDAVPGAGAKDLRKSRGALDNIVITSTNAARALEPVMPEIARVGFMADSVRIPTSTTSLIILNLTLQGEMTADGNSLINRESINRIYQEAAEGEARGLVAYSEEQNVSSDLRGYDAAVVIEAVETHTRTGFVNVRLPEGCTLPEPYGEDADGVRIPVTHVKIFGWYDNEMGSYTHRLGELTEHVAARALG